MSEEPTRGKEMGESKKFITQKITGRNDRGRKLAGLFFKTVFVAVVFTVTALCAAAFLIPRLHLTPPQGEDKDAGTVYIGRDELETPAAEGIAETKPDGSAGSESGAGAEDGAAEERNVRGLLREAIEDYPFSKKDALKLLGALQAEVNLADASVASVRHYKEGKDWFDHSLSTEGVYSGVAVAKTETELLLLTTAEAVEGADALTVHFQRGSAMDATVKRTDAPTGLAILSLAVTDENRELIETVDPLPLGNSYRLRRGDFVIALGAPLGIVHSADYGIISSISNGVNVTDGLASLIYADCAGSASGGTWILNGDGELVGWATDALADARISQTAILGLSDFKIILERMINGQASPYFGMKGVAVRKEQEAQGVPAGVYVTEEKRDSPAYEAGIQPGDIIVQIGSEKITSMREYSSALEKTRAEETVSVLVMRNGRDAYTPIGFEVKMGAR